MAGQSDDRKDSVSRRLCLEPRLSYLVRVLLIAGVDLLVSVFNVDLNPVAVEFDFMEPLFSDRRLGPERCRLGFYKTQAFPHGLGYARQLMLTRSPRTGGSRQHSQSQLDARLKIVSSQALPASLIPCHCPETPDMSTTSNWSSLPM
jgi:hypothetical protein